jgi:hypothetical protein
VLNNVVCQNCTDFRYGTRLCTRSGLIVQCLKLIGGCTGVVCAGVLEGALTLGFGLCGALFGVGVFCCCGGSGLRSHICIQSRGVAAVASRSAWGRRRIRRVGGLPRRSAGRGLTVLSFLRRGGARSRRGAAVWATPSCVFCAVILSTSSCAMAPTGLLSGHRHALTLPPVDRIVIP